MEERSFVIALAIFSLFCPIFSLRTLFELLFSMLSFLLSYHFHFPSLSNEDKKPKTITFQVYTATMGFYKTISKGLDDSGIVVLDIGRIVQRTGDRHVN
jgi:hypothetical protein